MFSNVKCPSFEKKKQIQFFFFKPFISLEKDFVLNR